MTLTEQWKKGELPDGWYWVDYYSVDGAVMLEYIPKHNGFGYEEKNLIQAVLAPVPSYDEWQRIFHYASKYEHEYTSCAMDYENSKQENAQLKDLLKECKERLIYCTISTHDVQTKIDEVLNG